MPRKAVDSEVRLQSLNLKTTSELRDRMESAASETGRALTHEVEVRLNRTFEFDYLFGDDETALVLRALGTVIRRFEKATGKSWVNDSLTQEVAYEAAAKLLEMMMKPDPRMDDRYKPEPGTPGIPVDWDNEEFRAGLRTITFNAIDAEWQAYKGQKNRDLITLRSRSARKKPLASSTNEES